MRIPVRLSCVSFGAAMMIAIVSCSEPTEPAEPIVSPQAGIVLPPNVPPGPPNDAGKPVEIGFIGAVGSALPGSTVALEVAVVDQKGRPVSGRIVEWSGTGGGLFDPAISQTDDSGIASTSFTVSTTTGTEHVVTAATGVKSASTTVAVLDLAAVIGTSTVPVPRADTCGSITGRLCESLIGNVIADAMRITHSTDFAIMNSGSIRADLTCPTTDDPTDSCPAFTMPPYPITLGQILEVLPLGGRVATLEVDGAELKTMLENAVASMPGADGRFGQVSGLCFTYDIDAAPGGRVLAAVRQTANGACAGSVLDLTVAASYTLAGHDFMVAGGDGYPDLSIRATTHSTIAAVLANYIAASTPINPAIQGRITCTTSGATSCPPVTP